MPISRNDEANSTPHILKQRRRPGSRILLLCLACGSLLATAFVLGFATQRYQFFPYRQIVELVRTTQGILQEAEPIPTEIVNRQYVRDREHLSLERSVDSVLLPLRLEGLRVSEVYEFAKGAGSITAVGNAVVILDRLGNVYAYRPSASTVEKLAYPPLPNHIEKYVASAHYGGLDDRKFRAHHVLFLPSLNSMVVSHSYFDAAIDWTRLAVSVIGIDPETLDHTGDWKTVFLSDREPLGSYEGSGGALLPRGSNALYLALGDRPIQGGAAAQLVEVNIQDGTSRTVSIGHRNTTGMTVMEDGRVIAVDQGPFGGDEINVIGDGLNYGWPNVSLGTAYGAYHLGTEFPAGNHQGFAEPLFAWLPSVGVSDVLQCKEFNELWKRDLLVSSLKGLSLYRLRLTGDYVQYSERIFIGQRIRDLDELEDGTIVLWTDDAQLLFLSVDDEKLATGVRVQGHDGDAIGSHCLFCHHFGPTNISDFAPTLSGLLGRRIASDSFQYSTGLRSIEDTWSEDNLREFLTNPGKFAPGTSMPNRNLTATELDEIIDALAETLDQQLP